MAPNSRSRIAGFGLRLHRFLTGDRLRVHLHALCWNEARLLPYFFRHYDPVVDRYFIYDNGSTDGSLALLQRHPKVSLEPFVVTGHSFVAAATAHYNLCWKRSRGGADWVFVVNIDEHLYHPRLRAHLRACTRHGVSVLKPAGYNMVSTSFPTSAGPLWKTIRHGAREPLWDKPQFFDPNRVDEINFGPGRHTAEPAGTVTYPRTTRTKLLHFKYLGVDYLVKRHAELGAAIPASDLNRGWGFSVRVDGSPEPRGMAAAQRTGRARGGELKMDGIDGGRLVRLRKVINERGHLLEIQRIGDDHFAGIAQAYTTCTLPGIIKAWYKHEEQFDQIALVHGEATVVLYDGRERSSSKGHLMECVLNDRDPGLIQIPPGVWHGFRATGKDPVYLLHLNSRAHDPASPDEARLACDSPLIPYAWR